MYFNNLIESIKKDNHINNLFRNIINPFSGYLLSQHFIGYEISIEKRLAFTQVRTIFSKFWVTTLVKIAEGIPVIMLCQFDYNLLFFLGQRTDTTYRGL